METPTREELFRRAAQKMQADFEALRSVPHAGAKGAEAEDLVRKFLSDRIPGRFEASSGFIIDRSDQVSRQQDVVIYDAFNCSRYLVSDHASFFPSDNVAATLEVKSRLDKEKLEGAFSNIESVKRLQTTALPAGVPNFIRIRPMGCVFAFESALSLDKVAEHYHGWLSPNLNRIGRHADVVVVLNKGIVSLNAHPPVESNLGSWAPFHMESALDNPELEGWHIGVAADDYGEHTLDVFMRLLLPQLEHFRHAVDHPGFDWKKILPEGGGRVWPLQAIATDPDTERREAARAGYIEAMRKKMED